MKTLEPLKSSDSIVQANHGPMQVLCYGSELDKASKQDQQPVQKATAPGPVSPHSRKYTPRGEVKELIFHE